MKKYRIGKVYISATNIEGIVKKVSEYIHKGITGYICVSNMRTTVVAYQVKEYAQVMKSSLMNIPDGTPLVWCARLWGIKDAQRTCGPDVFSAILEQKGEEYRHFFLGDTNETLNALRNKCVRDYGTNVVGVYSPPFLPVEKYDIASMAKMINESGATIVWLSLRAPKQDYLAAKLEPHLNGKVIIGVGAAFRFLLGEYKAPKGFLQKIGLAGLLCLRNTNFFKELWWYIKHACFLFLFLMQIVVWRIMGKKCDE